MYDDYREEEYLEDDMTIELTEGQMGEILEAVERSLTSQLKGTATTIVKESIEKLVAKEWESVTKEFIHGEALKFMEKWANEPRQKSNRFGEKGGEVFTFTDEVTAEWKAYFNEAVYKSNGQPSSGGYHDHKDTCTRARWLIKDLAVDAVEAGAAAEISKVGAEARKRVQESVAKYIQEQLAPAVRAEVKNLPAG